jgi:small GTP-binding protein
LTVPVAPRPAGAPGIDDALSLLLGLPDDLLSERTRRDLVDAPERLGQGRCNLVVLGEFKRGKSTLVNALLGRPLLPTGVLPLTSVVTVVRAGRRDRLVVEFAGGRTEAHAISELARYATEVENPRNKLGVELTTIEIPSTVLDGGIQLVDTPGIGSVHTHNTEAAHGFAGRTDAAIVVLSADQLLSAQERELLAAVDRIAGRVLVVLNRIDLLDTGDRASAIRFVERAVASARTDGPPVIAVSAREGTGIETLRGWIDQLPRTDDGRWAASERSVRRRARTGGCRGADSRERRAGRPRASPTSAARRAGTGLHRARGGPCARSRGRVSGAGTRRGDAPSRARHGAVARPRR